MIQRENDLDDREMELFELASRTNVDLKFTQFGEEDHPNVDTLIAETKNMENVHQSSSDNINSSRDSVDGTEKKYHRTQRNLEDQEKDMEEKRNLLSVRSVQLREA